MEVVSYIAVAVFLLALTVLPVLLAGRVAKRKGYNQVLFMVVGLVLGFLGVILAAVLPTTKKQKQLDAVVSA
jgi:MFS family permease